MVAHQVSRFGTACVVPFQAAKIRHTSSSHRACRTVRHVQCAASREHASRPSATERPDLPSRRSVLLSSAVVIGTLTTTLPATALGCAPLGLIATYVPCEPKNLTHATRPTPVFTAGWSQAYYQPPQDAQRKSPTLVQVPKADEEAEADGR